ncbi:MAG TPA: PQQ-binding-like beta-propeller repeat protein [Vicinamibacterales bacterium]|nr:PQQ-binding-like beta-propeller repeat protein [Vicinamibacterales bacterium]
MKALTSPAGFSAAVCALVVIILGLAARLPAQVTDQELLKPDPSDWVGYSGTYNSHRHSLLKQITTDNVKNLQAKWVFQLVGQQHVQAVPIVADGVMYVAQFNRVDAIDARTGSLIWQYQRDPVSTGAQRGTAIHGNKVFVTTTDSKLVALDARTGNVVWEVAAAGERYRFAGQAPLIAKGKIIVGGNQPFGFLQAYDVETGKHLWTWNAVPTSSTDPGAETWAGDSWKLGGGPMWVSGSFDPELNTIFYGTGQPGSQWAGDVREGDNLFTDCVVALDVDSGKMKWHFQFTPHDVRDWDALEMPVLIDAPFRGQPRKLLVQANRNGYYYVLDRTTGRFLHGTPFVSQLNWSSGLSPEGRPILIPGTEPSVLGSKTCPSTMGATNWPSPAYNPDTGYFYVIAQEGCSVNFRVSDRPGETGGGYIRSPKEGDEWRFYLRALDATTGKKVWEYQHIGSLRYGPGILSTAGGLVFAGEHRGLFTAVDARTGKPVWHFNTGALITSAPVSYSVNGQQFVAIVSGATVMAFALPESSAR